MPPSRALIERPDDQTPQTEELRVTYRWVFERFCKRDLSEWSVASLHKELSVQLELVPPPFSEEILKAATINRSLLNEQIALRLLTEGESAGPDPLLGQLRGQANVCLMEGRYREGSALFEFYERQHPDAASAINNRGFCLIPADPAEALHHIERAEKAGFRQRAISVYNQCCCLAATGLQGRALDLAEYYWQRERESSPVPGTLWRQSASGWELYSEKDVRAALPALASNLASQCGREDRESIWELRAE